MDTKNNTADLFTKHLDGLRRALAKKLGLRFLDMVGGTNVGIADGGPLRDGSIFFLRNVIRNRAAIEVKRMKNKKRENKNLNPGPLLSHSALQASYLFRIN